ncbi:PPE family protein [Mycobacterium sp. pUA109]|uniref:PPE family protein n=1 Tax=Mycobacterium sp. pUA109 TaxID=3238982 RepID=UPI00351B834C
MPAPIWIALPPEVHSALLSSGPGPGPLLAAAGAWTALSTEYSATAEELTALLAAVQAGSWEGPSAEEYVAAHLPYLAWLTQTSATSAAVAAQHEVAAAAYSSALAAMPTLAELAANHVTHGVLVATNFFGINTIPIAVNEADYARMWAQAAATMSGYQDVADAAVATVPRSAPAPTVLKSDTAGSSPSDSTSIYQQLLQFFQNPVGTLQKILSAFATNPAAALTTWGPLLFAIGYNVIPWPLPFYLGPAAALALPIAIGLGLNLLAEQAGQTSPPDITAAEPGAPVPATPAAAATRPEPMPGAAAPIPGPGTPASTPGAGAAATTPAHPLTTGSEGVGGYLVGGTAPDPTGGPPLTDRGDGNAPATPVPAAAAATAVTREPARARRRRRLAMQDYADEYLDLDPDAAAGDPVTSTTASDRGAGPMGFAGTARRARHTRGLATLTGDTLDGDPTVPMVPGSWDPEPDG